MNKTKKSDFSVKPFPKRIRHKSKAPSSDDALCQKKIADQLDPYRTMCLHFGWHIPYLLLTSAKAELMELAQSSVSQPSKRRRRLK
jgi:hypothetical protein